MTKYQHLIRNALQVQKFIASRIEVLVGASWYFIEKIVKLIGAVLISAWVARFLGPGDYGTYIYALSLVGVIGFASSLGIESIVIRDLILLETRRHLLVSTYFFIRLFGALLSILLIVLYNTILNADSETKIITLICGCIIAFSAFDVADCFLQSRTMARTTSMIRLLGFALGALGKIFLILNDYTLIYFAIITVLEFAIMAFFYFRVLVQNNIVPSFKLVEYSTIFTLLDKGKIFIFSGFVNTIYSKVDVLLLGILMPKSLFAPYALAVAIYGAWNMLGTSIVQAWAPRIARAKADKKETYFAETRYLLFIMMLVSVSGSAILSYYAAPLFQILYGDAYMSGASVLSILIWSSVPVFLGIATNQVIVLEELYYLSLLGTVVGIAVSVGLIFPAVKVYGINGAALVVVISSSVSFATTFAFKIFREQLIYSVKKF